MIENVIPHIWAEKAQDMKIDFSYNEFDNKIKEFDKNINIGKNLTNTRVKK